MSSTEGNEICEEGNEEIEQAFGAARKNAKPEELGEGRHRMRLVPNIQGQIDDLRGLDDSDELSIGS